MTADQLIDKLMRLESGDREVFIQDPSGFYLNPGSVRLTTEDLVSEADQLIETGSILITGDYA